MAMLELHRTGEKIDEDTGIYAMTQVVERFITMHEIETMAKLALAVCANTPPLLTAAEVGHLTSTGFLYPGSHIDDIKPTDHGLVAANMIEQYPASSTTPAELSLVEPFRDIELLGLVYEDRAPHVSPPEYFFNFYRAD